MKFIESVFQKLRKHPKRVVFPEGTEPRVLAAAAEFVHLQLGVAVLLGKRDEVEAAAQKAKVSLNKILIIDPRRRRTCRFSSSGSRASAATRASPRPTRARS
jgi:phosphate acetyltransferase